MNVFNRLVGLFTGRNSEDRLSKEAFAELILQSGLFDAGWYLAEYQDVASSGIDPLFHYIYHGSKEGRNPGPNFDTEHYSAIYPEVSSHRLLPICHYMLNFPEAELV